MKIIQATLAELEQAAQLFNDYRVFYDQEPDIDGALVGGASLKIDEFVAIAKAAASTAA